MASAPTVQLEHRDAAGHWVAVARTTPAAAERFLARLRPRDRSLWRVRPC